MSTWVPKAVRELRRGDIVELASGHRATIHRVYRETIFEGDVWTIEHGQGQDTAKGLDKVMVWREGLHE